MTGDVGARDKGALLTRYLLDKGDKTGFCGPEYDEEGMFVWTKKRFFVMQPERFHYLYLKLGTDRECRLHVAWDENSRE